jgi:hypothetical protein
MLTAIAIKLDSPGPVFFVQERMGLDAKPFYVLKFRSMRMDADQETGPVWARPDDPRRSASRIPPNSPATSRIRSCREADDAASDGSRRRLP